MMSLGARIGIGVASIAALVLACVLPGSYLLSAGMLAYLLLPLLIRLPIGVQTKTSEGARIFTSENAEARGEATIRIMGALAWVVYAAAAAGGPEAMLFAALGLLIGGGCGLLSFVSLFGRVVSPLDGCHAVTLDRETLTIGGPDGSHVFRYSDVREVDVAGRRISVSAGTDKVAIDVSGPPEHAARIGRAILEAKAKAGRNAPDDRPGVRELHRPKGMGTREWLGRLDALAATTRDSSAYRGGANVDEDELWTLFNDKTADAELRAAAARVLTASADQTVRVRVAVAAEEVGEEAVRDRVRIAIKSDADEAAEAMDALEMDELRKGARV